MKLRLIAVATAIGFAVLVPALQASSTSAGRSATTIAAASTVLQSNHTEVHADKGLSGSPTVKRVAAPSATSSDLASTTGTTRTGTRSVLIMMVNWTQPNATTPAAAQRQIGVSTNSWYRDVSSGHLGFSAVATPWMTLPKSDCGLASGGYWKVLAAAEQAATARGYTPSSFDHEMVYFPFDPTCNYGGLGATDGRVSWVNGEMSTRVTAHELGHNLGLKHAHSAICSDTAGHQVSVSAKCSVDEYGDSFDAMGVPAAGIPSFNALQMNRLGWLTGHVTTPTTNRWVTLSPLENGAGTLAARIRVAGSEYWLEYRQPVGVDSGLRQSPGATDGILVHRVSSDGGTDLLDARPDSTKSLSNAALPVGRTFTAPGGFAVKVTSLTSSRVVVHITLP